MSEIVLPRRAQPQPQPFRVACGDCGACVLGGILGLSVDDAYARSVVRRHRQLQSFCHRNMADAFDDAVRDGLADRAITRAPVWPVNTEYMIWGACGANQWQAWSHYVRMALDAGYYGAAEINMEGGGPSTYPNHWVMLCGWRPSPAGTSLDEVLVSCSARHPEGRWIAARDFLQRHGGFNALFARPVKS